MYIYLFIYVCIYIERERETGLKGVPMRYLLGLWRLDPLGCWMSTLSGPCFIEGLSSLRESIVEYSRVEYSIVEYSIV